MRDAGGPPGLLGRARRLSARDGLDLLRAAAHLAQARWLWGRSSGTELLRHGRRPVGRTRRDPASAEDLVARVAVAIPRAATRLPWRADCWIQALAAQAWLARAGIGSDLYIGTRQNRGGFEAHAWLRSGDRVVTGGDGAGYVPVAGPGTPLP